MTGRYVLRADAGFLLLFGSLGLAADLGGYLIAVGPLAAAYSGNPLAIGSTEAHGLAVLLALTVLGRSAAAPRADHGLLAAVHGLLVGCNLIFWPVFAQNGMLPIGFVATALHGVFLALNLMALRRVSA